MDCFLIKDCLWNETEQIQATSQFVRDAIQKHGYSLKFNFKGLKDELDEFKTEIKEETKFEKDTRIEILTNARTNYYEIIGMDNYNNLISQFDFKALTNSNRYYYLYYWESHGSQVRRYQEFNIRKGNSKHSIFINDKEYPLKTTIKGEKRQITKKPHKKVEEDWDNRVSIYLDVTNTQKDELEAYRTTDLKHLRTNLFVNPELANIVVSHLISIKKEIEKFEIEIRKIQNDYKKLKDEEILIQ